MNKKLVRLHNYLLENNLEKEASALDYIIKYSGAPGSEPCFATLENDAEGCSDEMLIQTHSGELSGIIPLIGELKLKLDNVNIDDQGASAGVDLSSSFDITLVLAKHTDSQVDNICGPVVVSVIQSKIEEALGGILKQNSEIFSDFDKKQNYCDNNKLSLTYTFTPTEGAKGRYICICISEDVGAMVVKAGVTDIPPDAVASNEVPSDEGAKDEDVSDTDVADEDTSDTDVDHGDSKAPQASSEAYEKPVGIILSDGALVVKDRHSDYLTVSGSLANTLRSGPDCGYNYEVNDLINDFMTHSGGGYSQWYQGRAKQFDRLNGGYINRALKNIRSIQVLSPSDFRKYKTVMINALGREKVARLVEDKVSFFEEKYRDILWDTLVGSSDVLKNHNVDGWELRHFPGNQSRNRRWFCIFKNLNSLDAMRYFSDYIFELILSEYAKDNASKVRNDMVSWSDRASQELNSDEIINPDSIKIDTLPGF